MTCPAACALYDDAPPQFWFAHENKRTSDSCVTCDVIVEKDVVRRAGRLADDFLAWLFRVAPDCKSVAIEDYAFAATGRVYHIGENCGILKYKLSEQNITYVTIPPTVIKKFATGKGNAVKQRMVEAFLRVFPAGSAWIKELFPRMKDAAPANSPLADLADAYWIANYFVDKNKALKTPL